MPLIKEKIIPGDEIAKKPGVYHDIRNTSNMFDIIVVCNDFSIVRLAKWKDLDYQCDRLNTSSYEAWLTNALDYYEWEFE